VGEVLHLADGHWSGPGRESATWRIFPGGSWSMGRTRVSGAVVVARLGERWPAGARGSGERERKNDGRGCGEDRGGEGTFYRPGWSIGEAVMAGVGGQTRVL
jgi:hypothetical protein